MPYGIMENEDIHPPVPAPLAPELEPARFRPSEAKLDPCGTTAPRYGAIVQSHV